MRSFFGYSNCLQKGETKFSTQLFWSGGFGKKFRLTCKSVQEQMLQKSPLARVGKMIITRRLVKPETIRKAEEKSKKRDEQAELSTY